MPKFISKGNSNERSLYVHWLGNINKSYKTHADGDETRVHLYIVGLKSFIAFLEGNIATSVKT